MTGFSTLLYKELLRFWKVGFQTILAPLLTSLLYLLVFSHVLEEHVEAFPGVGYTAFLIPGLAMMSVLQNAFANSSSSLIQSKITGNIVFVLLPPLSYAEVFWAYTLAASARGLVVGAALLAASGWLVSLPFKYPLWVLVFALLGSVILGALGIIAGIWAEKFDQMAAFQNFIIMPLTFLSGVFYSIHSLPPFWQGLSHVNPFFYMIDGFRYGFFGIPRRHPDLHPERPALRACGGDGRRPPFRGGDRERRVPGQDHGATAPARLPGAGRAHARGNPRPVHEDLHPGAVGGTRPVEPCRNSSSRAGVASRGRCASPAPRTRHCPSCARRC
jgi:ABC-2 type transport system permease protein